MPWLQLHFLVDAALPTTHHEPRPRDKYATDPAFFFSVHCSLLDADVVRGLCLPNSAHSLTLPRSTASICLLALRIAWYSHSFYYIILFPTLFISAWLLNFIGFIDR